MRASILVVEDEPAIQELVAYTCSSNGYTVRRADSVGAARDAIVQELPDLVLLDWMLPDKPGLELLKNLRTEDRTRALPVIMLTARGGEADRVVGLDTGADDYVVKPFSPRELVSRIRAVFRRRAPQHSGEAVEYGPITVDPARHEVRANGTAGSSRPGGVQAAELLRQPSGAGVFARAAARQRLGRPRVHRGTHGRRARPAPAQGAGAVRRAGSWCRRSADGLPAVDPRRTVRRRSPARAARLRRAGPSVRAG